MTKNMDEVLNLEEFLTGNWPSSNNKPTSFGSSLAAAILPVNEEQISLASRPISEGSENERENSISVLSNMGIFSKPKSGERQISPFKEPTFYDEFGQGSGDSFDAFFGDGKGDEPLSTPQIDKMPKGPWCMSHFQESQANAFICHQTPAEISPSVDCHMVSRNNSVEPAQPISVEPEQPVAASSATVTQEGSADDTASPPTVSRKISTTIVGAVLCKDPATGLLYKVKIAAGSRQTQVVKLNPQEAMSPSSKVDDSGNTSLNNNSTNEINTSPVNATEGASTSQKPKKKKKGHPKKGEPGYLSFRERNNLHVKVSRQKSKGKQEEMDKRMSILEEDMKKFREEYDKDMKSLKEENVALKDRLDQVENNK